MFQLGEAETAFRVHAAGVNFADSLMVGGTYQVRPPFPFTPGLPRRSRRRCEEPRAPLPDPQAIDRNAGLDDLTGGFGDWCSTPPRWCRSPMRWISSPPPPFRLPTRVRAGQRLHEDYGTGGTRPGRPPREIRLACCKATNFRRSLIRDPAGRSGIKGALSFPETDQCTFS